MAKQDTEHYKSLISNAKQFEHYASVTSGASRERWAKKAQDARLEAEAIPDNFIDPEWRMPEWGTRGT
jgi:hypothetical protein